MHSLRPVTLFVCLCCATAAFGQEATEFKPPSKEVLEAWKKAGAEYGVWKVNELGIPRFTPKDELAKGELPGFRLKGIPRDAPLTDPGVPFALNVFLIDDDGVKALAGLQSLDTLYLDKTRVRDAGLKELAALKSLRKLYLSFTKVTDAGMKDVAALKSLEGLALTGTSVSDAGVKELAGLKSLRTLHLSATKVSDAGLKELAGRKSLQTFLLSVGT
jgi:hypothetical protein